MIDEKPTNYITIVCDEVPFYIEATLRGIDRQIKGKLLNTSNFEQKDIQKIVALYMLILHFVITKNPELITSLYMDLCKLTKKIDMLELEEYSTLLQKYLPPLDESVN